MTPSSITYYSEKIYYAVAYHDPKHYATIKRNVFYRKCFQNNTSRTQTDTISFQLCEELRGHSEMLIAGLWHPFSSYSFAFFANTIYTRKTQ